MAIKREVKAYIESELRDYHDTLKAIKEDREELILSSPIRDNVGGKNYDIGNPTQAKAIKLLTNKRLRRMEQTIEAINRVLEVLPEEKYRLVELRYWTRPQTLTDVGIAQKLCIGRTTYYRWVDDIIFALGMEMGLVNERWDKNGTF